MQKELKRRNLNFTTSHRQKRFNFRDIKKLKSPESAVLLKECPAYIFYFINNRSPDAQKKGAGAGINRSLEAWTEDEAVARAEAGNNILSKAGAEIEEGAGTSNNTSSEAGTGVGA